MTPKGVKLKNKITFTTSSQEDHAQAQGSGLQGEIKEGLSALVDQLNVGQRYLISLNMSVASEPQTHPTVKE